jgi:Ran GTPase-activating protein (RanGAP) involved in mRNA processing and transport
VCEHSSHWGQVEGGAASAVNFVSRQFNVSLMVLPWRYNLLKSQIIQPFMDACLGSNDPSEKRLKTKEIAESHSDQAITLQG